MKIKSKIFIIFFISSIFFCGWYSRAYSQDHCSDPGFPGCSNDGDNPSNVPNAQNAQDLPPPASNSANSGAQESQDHDSGDPINTYSGEPWITVTDFSYDRPGFPFKFERYYNRNIVNTYCSFSNLNWMSNYDMQLFLPGAPIVCPGGPIGGCGTTNYAELIMPHRIWRFTTTDGVNFVSPPGCFMQLAKASYGFKVTDKNGIVYSFSLEQGGPNHVAQLNEIRDLNNNYVTITHEPYISVLDGSIDTGFWGSRISTVVDSANTWGITFTYNDGEMPDPTGILNDLNNPGYYFSNPGGSQLRQITNSVGDVLQFTDSSGGQGVTQTIVSRNPERNKRRIRL